MKAYCSTCMKPCHLFVSKGPQEVETTEFWGMTAATPMGRDVAILSSCCMAAAHPDKKCFEEFDSYDIALMLEEDEEYL